MRIRIGTYLCTGLLALMIIPTLHAQTTVATDDHGNTASSATAVVLPCVKNGSLERAGDIDYFKFTLTAPAVVTASSGGTTDVVGKLFLGSNKTTPTEVVTNNDGAGAPNFRISQLLPIGTHYLSVYPAVYGTLGAYTVNFQVADPSATQPDISLSLGGANLPMGTLVDFGSASLGGLVNKDFVIGNEGDANLSVYGVRLSVTGILASGATFPFRLSASPAPSVEPGRQTTFRITFQSSVAATYNGKVTVVSNDGDEILYEIPLRGTSVGLPPPSEIAVRNGTVEVPNNGAINVGSTQAGVRLTKIITIANTGAGELKITGFSLVPVSAIANVAGTTTTSSFFIYNSTVPSAIPAGGQATFQVALLNLVAGSYAAKLTLNNNDTDENPTIINLNGTVTPDPVQGEIAVAVSGADVPNHSAVAYGDNVTGVSVTKDFVISNPGTATLNLTSWQLSIPAPVTVTATTTTTLGSAAATVTSASGLAVGMGVSGPFPAGTSISAIAGNVVTMSSAATSSISNAALLYFVGGPSTTSNAFSFGSSLPQTLAVGASATVKINYLPMQAGDHSATLKIYNNDLDENPFSIALSGRATVNPNPGDIAVSLNGVDVAAESNVDWGAVPVGTTALKSFSVTNAGSGELRLTSFSATPLYFYFGGTPSTVLPAGQSGSLVMIFKPAAAGVSYKSMLVISSTDPDENPYRFNLVGTGATNTNPLPEIDLFVNGAALASNGSFDFGSANSGSVTLKSLVVYNTGAAPLTITGVTVTQPAGTPVGVQQPFSTGITAQVTIAPGTSFSSWLKFAPTIAGSYAATVQIVSNDADENPFTINVAGTAIGTVATPEVAVSVGGVDQPVNSPVAFGSTMIGTPVSKQLVINNTGTAPLTLSGFGFGIPATGISTTAPVTAGSSSATVANASNLVAGMVVTGPFPFGTTITAISGASLTLSSAATVTSTNAYLTFYPAGTNTLNPFQISGVTPTSIAAGASATVTVNYSPTSVGNHSMFFRFNNNDSNENPFQLLLTGSATINTNVPEIGVSLAGLDVPLNGSVAYGSTTTGTAVSKQFIIANTGNSVLSLSGYSFLLTAAGTSVSTSTTLGSPIVTVASAANLVPGMVVLGAVPSGTSIVSISGNSVTLSASATVTLTNAVFNYYPAGTSTLNPFRIEGVAPTSVAAGATATLNVVYAPTAAGSHSMTLQFTNNDSNENPYRITLTGAATVPVSAAEISVFIGSVEQARNSTLDFGTIARGTTAKKDFIVRNTGTANLTISNVIAALTPTTAGTAAAFTAQFVSGSSTIAPAGSATVRITFKPGALSTAYSSTFNINNNDADENPYGFTLTGASNATDSEIGVSLENADIPINGTVNFGSSVVVGSTVSRVLTVTNSGNAPLSIAGIGMAPTGATTATNTTAGVSITTPPPYTLGSFVSSVAAGASATLTCTYRPLKASTDNWTLTIYNSDADEGSYKINFTATAVPSATPPEVGVSVGGVDVASGGTVAFSTAVNVALTKDIVISNTGTDTLIINGYWNVNSAPVGVYAFSSTQAPPLTIPAGGTGVWKVKFLPTTAGSSYAAKLTLFNSDPDESSYVINLTGSTTP